ncbi:MAG: hypothetical protein KBB83_02415 [Alphaproteobacteria bacterium]|nr:hypothetical protein [Alphaproteobacteria bacterium]
MKKNLTILLFITLISQSVHGSTFSDTDFPFQHDYMGSSSDSDVEEKNIYDVYDKRKWEQALQDLDSKAFTVECEGIKIPDGDAPFQVAKSTALRVSSYYRSKLRWLIRRMGTDYALDIFAGSYIPTNITDAEKLKFENFKVAFPSSVADLTRVLVSSYITWTICNNEKITLIGLIRNEHKEFLETTMIGRVTLLCPNYFTRRAEPKRLFLDNIPKFIVKFLPKLLNANELLTDSSNEAYTWLLYAYEKACIYFMRDFAKALVEGKEAPAKFRAPFDKLEAQSISLLYQEVKPQFKKGYKPKEDPNTRTDGLHFGRLQLREMMQQGILPTMGDLIYWGCSSSTLEPSSPNPDDPEADKEDSGLDNQGF